MVRVGLYIRHRMAGYGTYDVVVLLVRPPAGTEIVTVGVAESLGIEFEVQT